MAGEQIITRKTSLRNRLKRRKKKNDLAGAPARRTTNVISKTKLRKTDPGKKSSRKRTVIKFQENPSAILIISHSSSLK